MSLKDKRIKTLSDIQHAAQIIEMDGRPLLPDRGRFYILKMRSLILFFLFIPCIFAKSYYAKKELPGELNLILQSLAKIGLNEDEKKSLDDIILNMDRHFTSMEKDEIFFLVKASVYKTVLGYRKKNERIPSTSPKVWNN